MKHLAKMNVFWGRFRADDTGAVTVDLVVLTSAIVALAIAVLTSISTGSTDLGDDVGLHLASMQVGDEENSGPPPE